MCPSLLKVGNLCPRPPRNRRHCRHHLIWLVILWKGSRIRNINRPYKQEDGIVTCKIFILFWTVLKSEGLMIADGGSGDGGDDDDDNDDDVRVIMM